MGLTCIENDAAPTERLVVCSGEEIYSPILLVSKLVVNKTGCKEIPEY